MHTLLDFLLYCLFSGQLPPSKFLLIVSRDNHYETYTTYASRAGPSRCGAQYKTWARGPSEQWFYDVIVFSQPCYDRGRAQIYSKALTRELSTFAYVREEIRWFWRECSLLTIKFIWRFYWILKRKVDLVKMDNLPKHHGAGPSAAASA